MAPFWPDLGLMPELSPSSRVRTERPGGRRTADPLANRGERVAKRGDRLLGGGNHVVLQVKRLNEKRIGITHKPFRWRVSLLRGLFALDHRDLRSRCRVGGGCGLGTR